MRFADQFKRYESDRNNFSLYVWGYFMPWIDYYKQDDYYNLYSETTVYYNYYDIGYDGKYPKFF